MKRVIPICASIIIMVGCSTVPERTAKDDFSRINQDMLENPSAAGSVTYYVSPDGSNTNTGLTLTSPLKTIQSALDKAWNNGDIIYVMTGTYVETIRIWQDDITLAAYPDNSPIIDGGTTLPAKDWGSLILLVGDNNSVSGFELKNSNITGTYSGGYGLAMLGKHNTVSHMNIHHTWENGIVAHGDYNIVEDSKIWQTAARNSDDNRGTELMWSAGLSTARNNDESALIKGITSHAIFRRNTVYNNWGEGLSCYEADSCILEDNVIYDNWAVNLYLSDATNSLVQRNLIYASSDPAIISRNSRLPGILLADEVAEVPRSAHNTIINNFIYNSDFGAFSWSVMDYAGLDNVLIAHNTIVDGDLSTNGVAENMVNINSQIKNNIILGGNGHISDSVGIEFSNNNWSVSPMSGGSSFDIEGAPQIARTGSTAPGKLTPAYFRVLDGSPVINAAVPLMAVTGDFFNETRDMPDIGAHEFVNTTDTTAPSVPVELIGTASSPSSVDLVWTASTDNINVAGYVIYRNGTEIGASTNLGYTDTSVVENTTYNYVVEAYDDAGNSSAASNTATVSTPKKVAAHLTSYYVSNKTANSATINWTSNIPATGVVFYGTSGNNLSSQVRAGDLLSDHSVELTGLANKTRYYYRININSGIGSASTGTSSFRTKR